MSSSSSSKSDKEDSKGITYAQHQEEDDTRRLLDDPQNSVSQEHFLVPIPQIHEEEDHKSLQGSFT